MSRYLVDQIEAIPTIEVVLRAEVAEARGDTHLECIVLKSRDGGPSREQSVVAMFVYVGSTAHTGMLNGAVERDPAGFILTGHDLMVDGRRPRGWLPDRDPFLLETSVPGVFAAGDVRHLSVKRVGAAVGESSTVVAQIHQYLKTV
jgi:thioredoxin reductase (NADPH)